MGHTLMENRNGLIANAMSDRPNTHFRVPGHLLAVAWHPAST